MSGVLQSFNNISYSKEKGDKGKVKLNVEVENERFETAKERVYKRLAPTVEVQGFRPGKAPKNVIVAKLGPRLFEETLNELIPRATIEIIKRENLSPIDQIQYKLGKVAEGSGVSFTAEFTTFPDFELPDISKIKVSESEVKVEDSEVESVIKQMADESQGHEHDHDHEGHDHKHDEAEKKEGKNDKKEEVKIDDEWAKTLNLGVNNLEELKEKIKQELARQKKMKQQNEMIAEVIKKIAKKSKLEIPQKLIDKEVERMEAQYKERVENLGMKLEDFMRNQKTTLKELRKDWEKDAKASIESELILMKIAKEYDITVEDSEVDEQISKIEDEKVKKQYENPQAKRYLQSVLLKQKTINKIIAIVNGKDQK